MAWNQVNLHTTNLHTIGQKELPVELEPEINKCGNQVRHPNKTTWSNCNGTFEISSLLFVSEAANSSSSTLHLQMRHLPALIKRLQLPIDQFHQFATPSRGIACGEKKKLDIVFFLSISGIIRSLWIAFVNLQCRMLTYRRPQQLTSPHSNNLQSTGTDHIVSAHRTRRTNRTDWTNGNISNKTIEIPMPGGRRSKNDLRGAGCHCYLIKTAKGGSSIQETFARCDPKFHLGGSLKFHAAIWIIDSIVIRKKKPIYNCLKKN